MFRYRFSRRKKLFTSLRHLFCDDTFPRTHLMQNIFMAKNGAYNVGLYQVLSQCRSTEFQVFAWHAFKFHELIMMEQFVFTLAMSIGKRALRFHTEITCIQLVYTPTTNHLTSSSFPATYFRNLL